MHRHIRVFSWQLSISRPVRQVVRYITIWLCYTNGEAENISVFRTIERCNEINISSKNQLIIIPTVVYNTNVKMFMRMCYVLDESTELYYYLATCRPLHECVTHYANTGTVAYTYTCHIVMHKYDIIDGFVRTLPRERTYWDENGRYAADVAACFHISDPKKLDEYNVEVFQTHIQLMWRTVCGIIP